jgi:hypothetical protein
MRRHAQVCSRRLIGNLPRLRGLLFLALMQYERDDGTAELARIHLCVRDRNNAERI